MSLEYLWHLYDTGRAFETIKGYRSAISSVILWLDPTINLDPFISETIKGIGRSRPKPKNEDPKWDLNLVLNIWLLVLMNPLIGSL